MSLAEMVTTGREELPPRIMIYGTHGIGKSTIGASIPGALFLRTEDGLGEIDCAKMPLAEGYDTVMDQLQSVATEEHKYKALVVDSADWLERLIWQKVCVDHGVKNIEDIGYAKGYMFALTHWGKIIDALNYIRSKRNMVIVLIAHTKIERFENPETESYDRYAPRLHKHASAYLQEWCDAVLFYNYKVYTKKSGEGFHERERGVSDGTRVLYTGERPAYVAKNRYGMQHEIEMPEDETEGWNVLSAAMYATEKEGK